MDALFTTELITKGKPETYNITFHDDKYIFQSLTSKSSFSIRREEDEWHTEDSIEDELKNAATEKLETYLLSQH